MPISTPLILSVVSAIVAVLGLLTTWILRRRDKSVALIEYSIDRSTPVTLDNNMIGAFNLKIRCKEKIAEDVTVYLSMTYYSMSSGPLQLQERSVPTGLKYDFEIEAERARIFIPNFQVGDDLAFVLVARSSYVPEVMNVVVRSPKEIRVRQIGQTAVIGAWFKETLGPMLFGITLGIGVIVTVHSINGLNNTDTKDIKQPSSTARDIPRVVLTEAALDAGIDSLVTYYAQCPDPQYYSAGDIAVARVLSERDVSQRQKYKVFLSLLLKRVPKMANESRAHIFYSRARVDITLYDADGTLKDFQESKTLDPTWFNEKAASDPFAAPFNK